MTLAEMMQLLADNTTGAISAKDLRDIVTDLYNFAHLSSDAVTYRWSTAATAPAAGHLGMDQPWQTFATKMLINETDDAGAVHTFITLDNAVGAQAFILTSTAHVKANVTGPSVDLGNYREVPITVTD